MRVAVRTISRSASANKAAASATKTSITAAIVFGYLAAVFFSPKSKK